MRRSALRLCTSHVHKHVVMHAIGRWHDFDLSRHEINYFPCVPSTPVDGTDGTPPFKGASVLSVPSVCRAGGCSQKKPPEKPGFTGPPRPLEGQKWADGAGQASERSTGLLLRTVDDTRDTRKIINFVPSIYGRLTPVERSKTGRERRLAGDYWPQFEANRAARGPGSSTCINAISGWQRHAGHAGHAERN